MGDTHESSKVKSGSDPGYKVSWITKIMKATSSTIVQTETHATPRISKIPLMLRDTMEFEKYYVPRVVSLGPYHHDNPKLKFIQDLKPMITKMFVKSDYNKLDSLFDKLHAKIEEVRNCYEENSTGTFSAYEFTSMMLEDGCFIMYYIDNICISLTENSVEDESEILRLESFHLALIEQDLFLLENQVPYMVLEELMSFEKSERWQGAIKKFIKNHHFMVSERVQKRRYKTETFSNCYRGSSDQHSHDKGKSKDRNPPVHLLELLHKRLVGEHKTLRWRIAGVIRPRNANELLTVGICFMPSKTSCVTDIQFKSRGFPAYLELPTITVDESTRPMLLNLVAYEMWSNVPSKSWVTSYICFLHSLIDRTEDVKELCKAGILYNSLGSDEEVVKLFNEIATDLVPRPFHYADTKFKIQNYYQSKRRMKIWATQFKQKYFKTPWSALALIGAIVALFLSSVQTYFSVWSAPGECDALCKYLKLNHHL